MRIEFDETESEPLVGERRGIVFTSTGSYPVPTPLLTNTDVNAAADLSGKSLIDISYKEKRVLEIREHIFKKHIDEIYTVDPVNPEQVSWINGQITKAGLFAEVLDSIYTPHFVGVDISEDQIERIVRTQLETNLTIVTIPDSGFRKPEEMHEIVKVLSEEIRSAGKKPFYSLSIDMSHTIFSRKIDAIKSSVDGIVVVNDHLESHLDNLNELVKLSEDKRILRVLSTVERTYPADSIYSLYPLSFLFSDLYSVKYGFGFGKTSLEKDLTNSKRLDETSLGYLTIQKHKEVHVEEINCSCVICDGKQIDDIKIDFLGNLSKAFRVHEAMTVFNLSSSASALFHNSQLLPFLKEKKNISSIIKNQIGVKLVDF